MVPKETVRAPSSLPKAVLVRAKDPDFSTACSCVEERYCFSSMLNLSLSSSTLDWIPPSEKFFGQGGVVEIESQVSEGSDSVGSQGIAVTPLICCLLARDGLRAGN